MRRSCLAVVLVTTVTLLSRPAVAEDPPKKDALTLAQFKSWLTAKRSNDRHDLSNEAVDNQLKQHREVPHIRHACRKLFNVSEVTDKTIEQLVDWLCVNYDLSEEAAGKLTLAEALEKIKAKDKP
jgi:hypothetical protein